MEKSSNSNNSIFQFHLLYTTIHAILFSFLLCCTIVLFEYFDVRNAYMFHYHIFFNLITTVSTLFTHSFTIKPYTHCTQKHTHFVDNVNKFTFRLRQSMDLLHIQQKILVFSLFRCCCFFFFLFCLCLLFFIFICLFVCF